MKTELTRFHVRKTNLLGLVVIESVPREDSRGAFSRLFCDDDLCDFVLGKPIKQVNSSFTRHKGTIRGMHYQLAPYQEIKLVKCIKGSIWDVAVDMRIKSDTYLNWHSEILSSTNNTALLIPEGFAHGFQAMSDDAEIIYLTFAPYSMPHERGVNPLDPTLSIKWPLEVTEISDKDRSWPMIES